MNLEEVVREFADDQIGEHCGVAITHGGQTIHLSAGLMDTQDWHGMGDELVKLLRTHTDKPYYVQSVSGRHVRLMINYRIVTGVQSAEFRPRTCV